jgi:hypothetical protein
VRWHGIVFLLSGYQTKSEEMTMTPNKSPVPTPVGAGSSASRFTVFDPAWFSFFR